MDFPHMNDNQFPYIDNVDPYKFVNNFDYSRWEYSSINVKMMNVLWDNSLTNVPYFETDNRRNQYFQAKSGHTVQLQSGFIVAPEETIRVPLPYNVAYTYNYVRIAGIASGTNATLDYGSGYGNTNYWYYFIVDMRQLSPSTTELYLQLDYWTTFINSVNIPYMVLERGHAPMAITDVNTYLADPINNNEYLLAKDFDFGNDSTIVSNARFFPVGNGLKYVVFALPISRENLQNMTALSPIVNPTTPPTYDDEVDENNNVTRWGKDLLVSNYAWNFGHATDLGSCDLPIEPYLSHNGYVLNGYEIYAIEAKESTTFFYGLYNSFPYLFNAIDALYIIDDSCVYFTDAFTFMGKTLYHVNNDIDTGLAIRLDKSDFNYDQKYSEITKLYTYPYSYLELTDNFGHTATIHIENISGYAAFVKTCSILYPFLQYRCYFIGFDGDASYNVIQWKSLYNGLNDSGVNVNIPKSDFSKYMWEWEIPTYTIKMSASLDYVLNNHADVETKRTAAIYEYQTADRYANTTKANTYDSQNAAKTNIHNMSDTEKAAKDNTSNMIKINADAVSITDKGVADNNASVLNQNGVDNYTLQTTNQTLIMTNNNLRFAAAQAKNALCIDYDCDLIDAGVAQTGAQGFAATIGSAVNAALTTASTGAMVGAFGGPAGAAAGAVIGGAISVIGTAYSGMSSTNITATYAQAQKNNIIYKHNADFDSSTGYMAKITNIDNNQIRDITNNTMLTSRGILTRNLTNSTTNNQSVYDTETGNHARTNTVETTNNAGINATEKANATRTCSTEQNNADWTRDANWQAANTNLILRQKQAEVPFNNGRLQHFKQKGSYSGNAFPDVYRQRGVQMRIRTQSKSAIAQAGDGMLRYGYTVHRVWDISDKDFCKMEKFTFWKAEDIWITNNDKTADKVSDVIMRAFLDGVTVWTNPDEIGTVSIYDNPVREEVQP